MSSTTQSRAAWLARSIIPESVDAEPWVRYCPACGSEELDAPWHDPVLLSTPALVRCRDCNVTNRWLIFRGQLIDCGPAPPPSTYPHPKKAIERAHAKGQPFIPCWSHQQAQNHRRARHELPPHIKRLIDGDRRDYAVVSTMPPPGTYLLGPWNMSRATLERFDTDTLLPVERRVIDSSRGPI
jgi:hypothetical protein